MEDEDKNWKASFQKLPVLDQARLIELHLERANADRAERRRTIGREVCEVLMGYTSASIGHMQLSSLPVNEIVTTNYDCLFEEAAASIERKVSVLPYERPSSGRWLLKMHGCVSHPNDIVLTRGDYLRYGDRRAALRGIVQAMLITKHMLFVGFSLEDDNFQRIAEDVRKAVRGEQNAEASPFGTALTIEDNGLFRRLWSHDLDWVTFGASDESAEPRRAARQLEIFLDYLAAQAARPTKHVLSKRFKETAMRCLSTSIRSWHFPHPGRISSRQHLVNALLPVLTSCVAEEESSRGIRPRRAARLPIRNPCERIRRSFPRRIRSCRALT